MSDNQPGQLQNYSVDQAAGAIVLVLGAVASLLLVIWQSKCHCKVNLCYLFQCERRPPNEEEMKSLKDLEKQMKDKKDNKKKDNLPPPTPPPSPLVKTQSKPIQQPEPEPEPLVPQAEV